MLWILVELRVGVYPVGHYSWSAGTLACGKSKAPTSKVVPQDKMPATGTGIVSELKATVYGLDNSLALEK